MKIMKKYYKIIVTFIIILVIVILSLFIYKNLFKNNQSNRLEEVENYKLTKAEKNSVKEKLNELESVDNIEIDTNYKIIKIFLTLNKNVEFDHLKNICNESIQKISEKNLSYYDVEIFVDCNDSENNLYPKIGYKYKTNSEFVWNR